ncbi:ribonucleotide reductase subunit alpha [Bacillus phage Nachito]|nr:ribonucleotide reductase subunit alpha [Bacillus phage Nachito]
MRYLENNTKMFNEFKDTLDFTALEYDKKAVEDFKEKIAQETKQFDTLEQKLNWLIENDYYINFFEMYSKEDVLGLFEYAKSFNFEFQSFMAISKFFTDYALKTNDKKQYLEHYEDRATATALHLGRGNIEKAKEIVTEIMIQNYQPATPTFLNAGRSRRGEMVSCFLLEMDDSLNSINYNWSTAGQLSKIGGGVALNLSKLRARRESIKGIENAASGVLPVMKLLEDCFSYVNQLGQRKGAGAAYLNLFHWDIVEFLETKKINADEKTRIQSLSIGVIAPSKFFELAEQNKPYYVFKPFSVFKKYGVHLDDIDIDEKYEELVADPDVQKRPLDAREMLNKIAFLQLSSGYPYFMFKSNANKQHPLKNLGQIKMSNLCTEIFQLQEASIINDYGTEDVIKRDISCNLGSLNIANVMESKRVKEAVYAGMEAVTAVSDLTSVANAPGVKKANDELHSVGLGALNLHGYLAKNFISYESKEAKDFVNTFFMMMNFYSIAYSNLLAKEKGAFKGFEQSDYADGTYFEKYITQSFEPKTDKVKALFEGIDIPTEEDWKELMALVQKDGLYNAYRLAIAPTGSISYIQNATASVMPITQLVERRSYANSEAYFPMPYLSKDTYWYYKTAYNIDKFKLIQLVATIQQHIDQGISCTLFVNSDVPTNELARYYIYAHKKGLKSLYYTRTNKLSVEECISCAV